jgi:hypothetical protein
MNANTNPFLREGREEPGVGSHKISNPALFLPLIAISQRLFALLCDLGVKTP